MMKEVDPYYESGYHSSHYCHLMGSDELFEALSEIQVRFYFTPEQQQKRIFEYGCGLGQSIARLPRAAGWDVSGEAREACRRRGVPVFDDLDDVPRGEWDIIMCRHVLEHLEQPLDVLKTMRELVVPGGELFLVLPREDHYIPVIAPDINQHLYSWNFQTLNNLLFRAGWRPYLNKNIYMLGWKKFLPVRRLLGPEAYYRLSRFGGILRKPVELAVWARLA
jgi:SAM-dependent methyltransferase